MKYLEDLLFWVNERENIRAKKESGLPQPWTTDPVLSAYRFCNVDRNNDRVTKWIHNNWMYPNEYHPNLAFAMGIARMVNLPETLKDLSFPKYNWDLSHFIMTIEARKIVGMKSWTSAYMITGGYSAGGEPKEVIIGRVLTDLNERLAETPITHNMTLERAAEILQVPGIGSFLSAQIVADLKMSQLLEDATDWKTWCAPGPGSMAGLDYLHERTNTNYTNDQFISDVNGVKDIINAECELDLCAQNTQNCLCEFSKYVRAKHFDKRLKSKYVPYEGPQLAS